MDPAKKCIKTAVLTNQRTHCRYQDRHHTGLKHSGYTGTHIRQKIHWRDMPSGKHDDRSGNNSCQKNHKYIDADDTSDQHQEIWQYLEQMIGLTDMSLNFRLKRQDQDQNKCDQCCRKCDPEIFTEFIFHLTALSITGCNRGIGNERKVIAEHRPAHDRSHTKCEIKT